MKKVILLAVLAIFVTSVAGQSISTGKSYDKVTTDYTLTNTTPDTVKWEAAQHYPTTQDFVCNIDSTSGTHTNVAVALYGGKSEVAGDWTQIGSTVNWKCTSSDTTIIISNATANRYRRYRVIYTGTGTGVSTVDTQELKLYYE